MRAQAPGAQAPPLASPRPWPAHPASAPPPSPSGPQGGVCAGPGAPPAGRGRACGEAPPPDRPPQTLARRRPGRRTGSWLYYRRAWLPWPLGNASAVRVARGPGCGCYGRGRGRGAQPDAPPRPAQPRLPARAFRPPSRLRRRCSCHCRGDAGLRWAQLRRGADRRRVARSRPETQVGPGRLRRAPPPSRDAALRPSMAGPGPTFPLHRLVWANRHRELEAALHSRQVRPAEHLGCPSCLLLKAVGYPSPSRSEAQVACFSLRILWPRLVALGLALRVSPLHSASTPEPD